MSEASMAVPVMQTVVDSDTSSDVCLVLEGSYPFVKGGVSSWTQQLLNAHQNLTFSIIALRPNASVPEPAYALPGNVKAMQVVDLSDGEPHRSTRAGKAVINKVHDLLPGVLFDYHAPGFNELSALLSSRAYRFSDLFDSRLAWKRLEALYRQRMPTASYLQFFWTTRTLFRGLYCCLSQPLPKAGLYHAVSTGYAGLMAARLSRQFDVPFLITEHGIYTNERRVELQSAKWLYDAKHSAYTSDPRDFQTRDLWQSSFAGFARAAYDNASEIITLYKQNQQFQVSDGADRSRLSVIPNGVDVDALKIDRSNMQPLRPGPVIGLIGRVVPIKDILMFIRAVDLVREDLPNVQALILGDDSEDPAYAERARAMVEGLSLQNTIRFLGHVQLSDYFPIMDVLALTSLSEAQPLAILEAGAAGIPTVATDVGSCRELLQGSTSDPVVGNGGLIVRCRDYQATASALLEILRNDELRHDMGEVMKRRVHRTYNKSVIDQRYADLYRHWLNVGHHVASKRNNEWPA